MPTHLHGEPGGCLVALSCFALHVLWEQNCQEIRDNFLVLPSGLLHMSRSAPLC